ncbi:IS200/IS605 family transposase [Erysipelotrichaceae bacterium OPF54]|nr:IS200/IS605 family transposase [Erysipelotrichaceae bacterium OPF54]
MVRYHFVFCPRYRRKIFLIPGVEERFKELVRQICQEKELDILAMECDKDHVHLFVEAWPQQSIPSIMKWIKRPTSHIIRNEFPQLSRVPSLWTRSYFVSTAGEVSSETIQRYVETQKTRYE